MIVTVTLNASVDKLYIMECSRQYNINRVKKVLNTAGGKGINVAKALGIIGEEVTVMGFLGGYNGMYLENLITDPKIRKRFTGVSAETRCCINVWDKERNKSTEYLEPGINVLKKDLENFIQDYIKAIKGCTVVCISGSVPQGVPDDFYARLVKIAKDNDKKVILDASGIQFIQAYKEMPTVVKPNEDELKQIMDIDTKDKKNILYATKKMHSDGIKIAAVSLGKEGVVITCDKGSFYVRPPKVNVVNTVGCGDCMVAGFALGIHREYEIDDIIKNACAIATANTLTAATGVYKIADYITFLKQISIEKL